ncbi:hypothetical protein ACP275_04G015500 [Erythranthe tilingii]
MNPLLLIFIFLAVNSNALSIKLIHRHSTDSPFYPGNLTHNQRIKIHLQSSSAYANWLSNFISSSKSSMQTKNSNQILIRPTMKNQDLMYLIETGFGTFPPPRAPHNKYFLHIDTASELMWAQCDECRKTRSCFLQVAPLFPARQSKTYRPLPCNKHPLCTPGECIKSTCSYEILYADDAATSGYLAQETLTFRSDKNKTATVQKVVFGCGIKNLGFSESSKTNMVAGNFGMGPGKLSFLTQKRDITQGRFSYCLPPFESAHKSTTFLRFGNDVPQTKGFKSTPLIINRENPFYFVVLKGISIANKRVNTITDSMLARTNADGGYGGCIVDSGSTITVVPPVVYQKLKEMLIKNHFLSYKKTKNLESMDVCYLFPRNKGFKDLPNITFHFQDSDMVLPPQLGYIFGKRGKNNYFCLAMAAHDIDGLIVIGALQQANTRFVFDIVKRKLYFGHEDCTLGA